MFLVTKTAVISGVIFTAGVGTIIGYGITNGLSKKSSNTGGGSGGGSGGGYSGVNAGTPPTTTNYNIKFPEQQAPDLSKLYIPNTADSSTKSNDGGGGGTVFDGTKKTSNINTNISEASKTELNKKISAGEFSEETINKKSSGIPNVTIGDIKKVSNVIETTNKYSNSTTAPTAKKSSGIIGSIKNIMGW